MSTHANQMKTVYVSFGSNKGDKLANCINGIACLRDLESVSIENQSDYYLTEPQELKAQSWFLNGVVKIKTTLDPFALLNALKMIEHKFGRISTEMRYGPRVLDFDIIFYNNTIINTPGLVVPHPRMHKREFVLRPLCDLSPDILHPVLNKSVKQLLDEIASANQQCIKLKSMDLQSIQLIQKEKGPEQEENRNEIFY